jgi:hypothetical protein
VISKILAHLDDNATSAAKALLPDCRAYRWVYATEEINSIMVRRILLLLRDRGHKMTMVTK